MAERVEYSTSVEKARHCLADSGVAERFHYWLVVGLEDRRLKEYACYKCSAKVVSAFSLEPTARMAGEAENGRVMGAAVVSWGNHSFGAA